MQFPKTITDTAGDSTQVRVAGDEVHVSADTGRGPAPMYFTPKQARRLAKTLKRAANVADGKPAKPKPNTITDNDGDVWHLRTDGAYVFAGGDPMRRSEIKRLYGIRSTS